MDDKSWDDYIRETPGTIMGDEARRNRERIYGSSTELHQVGGRSGAHRPPRQQHEMSDASARIFLGFIYSLVVLYVGNVTFDFDWGWGVFFGGWAAIAIAQYFWPILMTILTYGIVLPALGTLVYFVYAAVTEM